MPFRSRNGYNTNRPFLSRGLHVWDGWEQDPSRVAAACQSAGFAWMAIKTHQGTSSYNKPAIVDDYRRAAHAHGIHFGTWGYPDARDPIGEAHVAAALNRRYRGEFYIADAELEYEQATRPVSLMFTTALRNLRPHLPLALTTFGRVDYHPGINYRAWRDHGFAFLPQAYFNESASLAPIVCVDRALKYWPASMVHPLIGAYAGANGRPSPAQLAASVSGLPSRGYSVWDSITVTPEDLHELARVW